MDSKIYHSQSSSYVGLLNSQQGSVLHENFPYESFQSSVNFGESEIPPPPFSSQQCEDTPVDRTDAVVGNDQKSGTFWKRVREYYAASPHGVEDGEKSEHLHCKQRWHIINDQVNKFCGAYSAAERQISSGESDTDVLKKAHDIFYSDKKSKFNLEHVWCVLRYEQKWFSLNTQKATASSKRKNGETDSSTNDLLKYKDNDA
ncbi:hypothetical protein BRARA_H00007 [Brassica rapa]|uniref:No apical meristem-associated C-terminal domain-containing protein n=1 Tax=Brassica campestris TaxID=3711 RepID=A0A397Y6H1_BRACM|nr:hypothetical protein BRARA_H00007 [Brassica rapa]